MRPPGTPTGRRNLWIVLSIVGVVIIIAAVIIVAVILGTGSSAQTPEQATNAFWAALKKKDFGGTWNMLSAEAQKAVGSKSNWEAALKKEFPENKAVVTVKAGKATINGNKATVTTTGIVDGKTETDTQHLLKENGVWKINVE
jgi:flagellar basal body-associated protein FliL